MFVARRQSPARPTRRVSSISHALQKISLQQFPDQGTQFPDTSLLIPCSDLGL
jgi:hypothetical protein